MAVAAPGDAALILPRAAAKEEEDEDREALRPGDGMGETTGEEMKGMVGVVTVVGVVVLIRVKVEEE